MGVLKGPDTFSAAMTFLERLSAAVHDAKARHASENSQVHAAWHCGS